MTKAMTMPDVCVRACWYVHAGACMLVRACWCVRAGACMLVRACSCFTSAPRVCAPALLVSPRVCAHALLVPARVRACVTGAPHVCSCITVF